MKLKNLARGTWNRFLIMVGRNSRNKKQFNVLLPWFRAGSAPLIPIFPATLTAKSSEYSICCVYLLNRN